MRILPAQVFMNLFRVTPRGFTLVELLVVIAIIGILAVVGFTIFSGVQKSARDARRQQDVTAIAKAFEANKVAAATFYPAVAASWFAGGNVPAESAGYTPQYTVVYNSTAGTAVTKPTVWAATSANPTAPSGTTATTVAASVPSTCNATTGANCIYNFQVCALLENGTAPNIYCRPSAQ